MGQPAYLQPQVQAHGRVAHVLHSPGQRVTLVVIVIVIQVERLVASLQDTITAPSLDDAVSVLEMLVTKLAILDSNHKQSVHEHFQVCY